MDRQTRSDDDRLERREVTVDRPDLSAGTNESLTAELREVVGDDHVTVPADRARPSRGEASEKSEHRLIAQLKPYRFIMAMIAGSSVVVAAILALVIGHWWILPLVFVVLAIVTAAVTTLVLGMTSHAERPSATTVAAMEEDGVGDPERHFSELVKEFTPEPNANGEHRSTAVEDDPAGAAAEQENAITPSGGPSQATGPGE